MSVAVDQLQGKEVELVKGKEFWVSSKFYMARATLHYLLFERFLHKLFSSKVKYLYSIVLLKSFLANAVNLLWKQKMHCLSIFEALSILRREEPEAFESMFGYSAVEQEFVQQIDEGNYLRSYIRYLTLAAEVENTEDESLQKLRY